MGDHCHRATGASIGEKLPGRPSAPEEAACSPHGYMDDVLGIAVFDPWNDAELLVAGRGASLLIMIPACRIEGAIVLGGQQDLVLPLGERLGQPRQGPGAVVGPVRMNVCRDPNLSQRSRFRCQAPSSVCAVSSTKIAGLWEDQLYHRSLRRIRATVRSVSKRDGQSERAADLGPRITAATCRSSRPRCRQTTGGGVSSSGRADVSLRLSASRAAQAGYSRPSRRASARLPHVRPLSSMNHAVPARSRRNSSMNSPRQPAAAIILSAGSVRSNSGVLETHALDPDP